MLFGCYQHLCWRAHPGFVNPDHPFQFRGRKVQTHRSIRAKYFSQEVRVAIPVEYPDAFTIHRLVAVMVCNAQDAMRPVFEFRSSIRSVSGE